MIFDSDVLLPQNFQIGDKPDHQRVIFERGTDKLRVKAINLFAATIRWPKFSSGFVFVEQLMTLNGNGEVTFKAPTALPTEAEGQIIVAALQDSGAVATLDVGIDSVASNVLVTISVGTIPASGFYRINSEHGTFTFTGSTVTFTDRGIFQTNAAAHLMGDTITFAATKETVIPKLNFQVQRDNF